MLIETMDGSAKKNIKKVSRIVPGGKFAYKTAKRFAPKFLRKRFFGSEPTWNDVLLGYGTLLGAKKKGGFLKVLKKIGKFTAPITTGIAKTFLPAAVVNAAAKLDPTRKGKITPKAVQQAVATLQKDPLVNAVPSDTTIKANALLDTLKNPKVLAIIGGGIVLLMVMKKRG